mgnify:CR=1 FL=1
MTSNDGSIGQFFCGENSGIPDTLFNLPIYYADSVRFYIGNPDTPVYTGILPHLKVDANNNFVVYPNPFSQSATVEYDLPSDADVKLEVYNIIGARIQTMEDAHRTAGRYRFTLGNNGHKLKAGVYFVTLQINGIKQSQKIIVTD